MRGVVEQPPQDDAFCTTIVRRSTSDSPTNHPCSLIMQSPQGVRRIRMRGHGNTPERSNPSFDRDRGKGTHEAT